MSKSYEQIGTRTPDGMIIGGGTTDYVGFYGITNPVSQASVITALTTAGATTTTPWGFATSTQANAIATAVNALITVVQNLGMTASS